MQTSMWTVLRLVMPSFTDSRRGRLHASWNSRVIYLLI